MVFIQSKVAKQTCVSFEHKVKKGIGVGPFVFGSKEYAKELEVVGFESGDGRVREERLQFFVLQDLIQEGLREAERKVVATKAIVQCGLHVCCSKQK